MHCGARYWYRNSFRRPFGPSHSTVLYLNYYGNSFNKRYNELLRGTVSNSSDMRITLHVYRPSSRQHGQCRRECIVQLTVDWHLDDPRAAQLQMRLPDSRTFESIPSLPPDSHSNSFVYYSALCPGLLCDTFMRIINTKLYAEWISIIKWRKIPNLWPFCI